MGSDKPPTTCHVSTEDVIHRLDLSPRVTAAEKAQWCGLVHIQSPSAYVKVHVHVFSLAFTLTNESKLKAAWSCLPEPGMQGFDSLCKLPRIFFFLFQCK